MSNLCFYVQCEHITKVTRRHLLCGEFSQSQTLLKTVLGLLFPAKPLLLLRHLEGAGVCASRVLSVVLPMAQELFRGEGKDFPASGNLAQDKHAGEAARIPLLKSQFHS